MGGWLVLAAMLVVNCASAELGVRQLRLKSALDRLLAGYVVFWSAWIPLVYACGHMAWLNWPSLFIGQLMIFAGLGMAARRRPWRDGFVGALLSISSRLADIAPLPTESALISPLSERHASTTRVIAWLEFGRRFSFVICAMLAAIPIFVWWCWASWRQLSFPLADWDSTTTYGVQLALMIQTQQINGWDWGYFGVAQRPLNAIAMMLLFCIGPHDIHLISAFKLAAVPVQALALTAMCRTAGAGRWGMLTGAIVPFACHSYLSQFEVSILYDDVIALLSCLCVLWSAKALAAEDGAKCRSYSVLLAMSSALLCGCRYRMLGFIFPLHALMAMSIAWRAFRQPVLRADLLRRSAEYLLLLAVFAVAEGGLDRLFLKAEYRDGATISVGGVDGKFTGLPAMAWAVTGAKFHLYYFLAAPFNPDYPHYFFSTHLGLIGVGFILAAPFLWIVGCWRGIVGVRRSFDEPALLLLIAGGTSTVFTILCLYFHKWVNLDGRYYLSSLFLMIPIAAFAVRRSTWLQGIGVVAVLPLVWTALGNQPEQSAIAPSWWLARYAALPREQQTFAVFLQLISKGSDDLDAHYLLETATPPGARIGLHSGRTRDLYIFGEKFDREVVCIRNVEELDKLVAAGAIDYLVLHHPSTELSDCYREARYSNSLAAQSLLAHCQAKKNEFKMIHPRIGAAPVARREVIFKVATPAQSTRESSRRL